MSSPESEQSLYLVLTNEFDLRLMREFKLKDF